MSAPWRTALRLTAPEAAKVLQFALLGLLLQAGLIMGMNSADSLFLSRVGASGLPVVYLLAPVVMALYLPVFSTLLDRLGIDRVFDGTLVLLAGGGVLDWWGLTHAGSAPPVWVCYAVKLYAAVWYAGVYTLFWLFADGYFDLVDAKRQYAFVAAGSAVGAMLGGAAVSQLAPVLGVPAMFLGWAACALASWPVLRRLRGRWRRLALEAPGEDGESSRWAGATAGVRALLRSRYAAALTAGLFFVLIAATLCDYQYLRIFSLDRTEAQLAQLLGRLTVGVNVFNLLVTVFAFGPLVARFGVRNVVLLQPAAFAAVFVGLLAHESLPTAVAGFFAYYGLMTAIDYNNVNLLFAGVAPDARRQVRALVEALVEPAAMAAAGFFLLGCAARLSPGELSLAGLVAALLGLACTATVRRDYRRAIALNLRRDWLDLARWPAWLPRPAPAETRSSISGEALVTRLRTTAGAARAELLRLIEDRADSALAAGVLEAAIDFSAWERRRAEEFLVGLGAAAAPLLAEAAASPRYSVRARSVALRALGKVDFDRLQAVAGPLMEQTARKAYFFLAAHVALETVPGGTATRVLSRIYRDYPKLAVQVVLEALTISGRLPAYEAIMVALNSGPSRERGYAIETIEQGAGRSLARLIAPWIDGRSVAEQVAAARRGGLLPTVTAREAIERSLASAFPLESCAAWQALAADPAPEIRRLLEAKRRAMTDPLLEETATCHDPGAGTSCVTPVDRVDHLMAASAFAEFDFTHFERLAPATSVEQFPAGALLAREAGPLDATWVVVQGELESDAGREAPRRVGAGEVVGAEALCGWRIARANLRAVAPTRAIRVPADAVAACADTFPALGVELLRRRVSS
jgi:hypothetical protein